MENNTKKVSVKQFESERKKQDRQNETAVMYLWSFYTTCTLVLSVLLIDTIGDVLLNVWIAVTAIIAIALAAPFAEFHTKSILAFIRFSIKIVLLIPFIFVLYGITGIPRHIRRQAKHFRKVQDTRKKTLN